MSEIPHATNTNVTYSELANIEFLASFQNLHQLLDTIEMVGNSEISAISNSKNLKILNRRYIK